ncbi:glucan biosynthesis glucosyltransferase H, partial [Rhodovulum sulfidophilum]|nr:glucan biosynthesis glucosyltransferase H [Rhodovulum sulfidophilum]
MSRILASGFRTRLLRGLAIGFSLAAASVAASLLAEASAQDGFDPWDMARTTLIFITTAWLAWGAAGAFLGLLGHLR